MNQKREIKELYNSVYGEEPSVEVSTYLDDKLNLLKAANAARDLSYRMRIQQLFDSYEQERLHIRTLRDETRRNHTKMVKYVLTVGITSAILAVVLITHLAFVYF